MALYRDPESSERERVLTRFRGGWNSEGPHLVARPTLDVRPQGEGRLVLVQRETGQELAAQCPHRRTP